MEWTQWLPYTIHNVTKQHFEKDPLVASVVGFDSAVAGMQIGDELVAEITVVIAAVAGGGVVGPVVVVGPVAVVGTAVLVLADADVVAVVY